MSEPTVSPQEPGLTGEPLPTGPAPKSWQGKTLAALALVGSLAVGSFYTWLAQQPVDAPVYQIAGQVTDADGNPVAGATVEARITAQLPAPAPRGWVWVTLSRGGDPFRMALVHLDDPNGFLFTEAETGPLGPGTYQVHVVSPAGYPNLVREFVLDESNRNPTVVFDVRDMLREPSAAGGL
jgi:hypothetical protein